MDWSLWQILVACWFAWRTIVWSLVMVGLMVAVPAERWNATNRLQARQYWVNRLTEAVLLVMLILAGFWG